ncbi:MAG: hypothetical protein SPL05_02050 [Eubacteriales bacterium]|nr:hypothetical protein [Eubacteriales bacterium]
MMKNKSFNEDDGRVIANMNAEGMPWYKEHSSVSQQQEPLTNAQTARVLWNAILASLLVALIFSAVFYVFILFCLNIWFRV